jgi:NADPH-dependent 7-cyano-7-deazaguanine reductase QueF-like protein
MIHFLLALKSIPKILNKKNKLIYQIKWVVFYGEDIVNIYYLSIVKIKKKEKQKMIRTRYRAYKNHLYL